MLCYFDMFDGIVSSVVNKLVVAKSFYIKEKIEFKDMS